jgi:chaperonin cofactor prefoldin
MDKVTEFEEFIERTKHIPTSTILKDIEDTRREIVGLEKVEEGYKLVGDRMALFRADATAREIRERHEFIKRLESILTHREEGAI